MREYLSGEAEKSWDVQGKKVLLKERQEEIKEGQIGKVIAKLRKGEQPADVEEKGVRYMENRSGQFKYKEALAAALTIGSGEI